MFLSFRTVLTKAKRETGENPARSRHCNGGVSSTSHWNTGKADEARIPEPGDLHKTFFWRGGELIQESKEQQIRAVGYPQSFFIT